MLSLHLWCLGDPEGLCCDSQVPPDDAVPESIPTAPEHACQCKGVGGGAQGRRGGSSSTPPCPLPVMDLPEEAFARAAVLWSVWFTFSPHSPLVDVLCAVRAHQTGKASVCSPDISHLKAGERGCPEHSAGG